MDNTNLYALFETSKEAESDKGVALDYGAAGKIWIHRAGGSNQNFINLYRAKIKPYNRQVQQGTMDETVATDLMAEIYAKTVIKGWEGVKDRAGNLLEFTEANVKQVLIDLPVLFMDIQQAAQDASLFRKAVVEEVVGNSPQP